MSKRIEKGGVVSYKEDIKNEIAKIPADHPTYESAVTRKIGKVYTRALRDSTKTGESLESFTYEILEGVAEALEERSERILQESMETITKILHENARSCIEISYRKAQIAQARFLETIEHEKMQLAESFEAFRAFVKERSLRHLEPHLENIEKRIERMRRDLGRTAKSNPDFLLNAEEEKLI